MCTRLLLIFFISFSYSQNQCQDKVLKIFDNIIFSIGNDFPSPPSLEFSNTENNPAWISPSKQTIFIENKLITLLCDDENFSEKIAYIISHEIAHHYLNHGWMKDIDFSYSSTIGDYLYDQSYSVEQRKNDEIQADNFGGFYSKISGYNSLDYGSKVLSEVYKHYNLKENISGYPSLEERKEIVQSSIDRTEKLALFFDLGNLALITENYFQAKTCFDVILKNNFNSREIFNNIGLTYLIEAINNSEENISQYNYPIFFENKTRAKNSLTRNTNVSSNLALLTKAKSYFELSMKKDLDYKKPLINLLITELIIAKLKNILSKDFLKKIESYSNDIELSILSDLKVLNLLLINKTVSKKLIGKASEISVINTKINKEENNSLITFPIFNKIESSSFIFLNRPYLQLREVNITEKYFDNYRLIKFGDEINVVEVFDKYYLNQVANFTTGKDNLYNKIIKLNNHTYKINTNNSIILKFNDTGVISSVILYNF